MSEVAIGSQSSRQSFSRNSMLGIVALGIAAFLAMLVLGAYAPDLRSGRNGGSHALSNAATGFSGLVRLAEATGRNPAVVRVADQLESEDLAVITPDSGATDLSEVMERRGARVTLLILPKWKTEPDPLRSGWVRVPGLLPVDDPEGTLAPAQKLDIVRVIAPRAPLKTVHPTATEPFDFHSPERMQVVSGEGLEPVIVDSRGAIVLAKSRGSPLYILADPDLLNNHGMADARQAAAALSLLDFLNSTGAESILFDVTANGLGHSRSPLRLAFDPPFLAITLLIFVAMALAGWQALFRFGEPRRPERALAFGKAALVQNSAALIRRAGRETRLAARYVDTIRERAAVQLLLPPTLDTDALDKRLNEVSARHRFAELAAAMEAAADRRELVQSARKLNDWLREVST